MGVVEIGIANLNDSELEMLSKKMLLSLDLNEMKAIQAHFSSLKREPTDIELETIAQTWSEHCKHKTFNARINYFDWETGKKEVIDSLFKTFIAGSTNRIAKKKKWLVSVFSDNAGIIKFNKTHDLAFKAETHNHPSALEPYGGANTGLGGVIRDVLGAGLGAKPIANTDVFCFASPDYPVADLPSGVLHPKRIAKGVRAGVRDYGNRMGIPTVNGAIVFDDRYLGNPLVYCGCIGIIPKGMHKKAPCKGDLIVVLGGRTGKDGLHGATFSSIGLDESSPVSAVQIGNAIEERKVMDAQLKARDEGLYTAVTDCGAGGFSSAVGELAEDIGAEVELSKAPLKYKGLSPWEIWLSESQERMVFSVPQKNFARFREICEVEGVEAAQIGSFTGSKILEVSFYGEKVLELGMDFLHKGVPRKSLSASWSAPMNSNGAIIVKDSAGKILHKLLAMPNIASKETTVRMYDHEVQGGSVIKPFMGKENDGPSDAAIIVPFIGKKEGIAIANGINPFYSDIDSYWMAASTIDEAIRNLVCVGCTLDEVALLDNFSWGNPNDPKKLGSLVRAVKACSDFSIAFDAPLISGKDSLYNEYISKGKTISIPGTLLISSIGVMKDASKRISMYTKRKGSNLYLVGETKDEFGGSHFNKLHGIVGSTVPIVDAKKAKAIYKSLGKISSTQKNSDRIVLSMHDLSEGGLAVSLAEMSFAGMLGIEVDLSKVACEASLKGNVNAILFSESNSRILAEVAKGKEKAFEKAMGKNVFSRIGTVTGSDSLVVVNGKNLVLSEKLAALKKTWKGTLDW